MYKLLDAAQAITLAAGCHAKCSSFDVKSYIPPLGSKPGLSPAIHWHKITVIRYIRYMQNLPQRATGMHTKLQTYQDCRCFQSLALNLRQVVDIPIFQDLGDIPYILKQLIPPHYRNLELDGHGVFKLVRELHICILHTSMCPQRFLV